MNFSSSAVFPFRPRQIKTDAGPPRLFCNYAVLVKSDLHADIPCAPNNSAQVADGNAVAHTVGLAVLAAHRSGDKADAVDNIIAGDLKGLAGLDILDGDGAVPDGSNGGLQIYGHLVVFHGVTQERGVGKAGGLGIDQVVGILDDNRVLALEDEVVSLSLIHISS